VNASGYVTGESTPRVGGSVRSAQVEDDDIERAKTSARRVPDRRIRARDENIEGTRDGLQITRFCALNFDYLLAHLPTRRTLPPDLSSESDCGGNDSVKMQCRR